MLNEKLKGMYSDNVVADLCQVAEELSSRGIHLFVEGLQEIHTGTKFPKSVFIDSSSEDCWEEPYISYNMLFNNWALAMTPIEDDYIVSPDIMDKRMYDALVKSGKEVIKVWE